MQHTNPTNLKEVAQDGLIAQAGVDHAYAQLIGARRSADFDADGAATGVDTATHRVRYFGAGDDLTLPARKIASVRDGTWTWEDPEAEEFGKEFNIPECWEPQPDSLVIEQAARTLHNNAPLIRAPRADGVVDILIILSELPETDPKLCIRCAVPRLTPDVEITRALKGFAAMRGLPISLTEWDAEVAGVKLAFRNGALVDIVSDISIDDVRADAIFLSAEYQFRADSLLPQCQGALQNDRGTALLRATGVNQMVVQAAPIAVMTNTHWTWAWADPSLNDLAAGNRLRNFGAQHGIPALVQPTLPIETAWALNLPEVAKPILGMWTHIVVPFGHDRWAMLLVKDQILDLPPATRASVEGVLRTKIDPVLDRTRCATAYATARQIHQTTNDFKVIFHTPDGEVEWSRY
ncbi:MAG: hypothetical protein Q4A92_01955 [Corynebacterium sp.]|nr:hypothetical protein [Corynebacterium sp.]